MTQHDDAADLPQTAAEPDSDWTPIPGRVIKGVVAYYNRYTHRIRITKRWHGARVTEDVKLPPPLPPKVPPG